jgi:hypothetical protein
MIADGRLDQPVEQYFNSQSFLGSLDGIEMLSAMMAVNLEPTSSRPAMGSQ